MNNLLLNSSSLKELLVGTNDPRKRKLANTRNEELVESILKQQGTIVGKLKRSRRIENKKKSHSKKKSLWDRSIDAIGLNRAKLVKLTTNNVYEYASNLGIDRYAIDCLERKFVTCRSMIEMFINKFMLGYEQLNGTSDQLLTKEDALLLLSMQGIDEISSNIFNLNSIKIPIVNNHIINNDDQMLIADENESDLLENNEDQLLTINSQSSTSSNIVHYNKFCTYLEAYIRIRSFILQLAELNGWCAKNTFENMFQKDTMESLLYNTSSIVDDSEYDMLDTFPIDNLDDQQLNSMFVSSTNTFKSNDLFLNTTGSYMPPSQHPTLNMKLDHSSKTFSQSNTISSNNTNNMTSKELPPLRLKNLHNKQQEKFSINKKQLLKAGFDESFTRATPRVLQSSTVPSIQKLLQKGSTNGGATVSRNEIEELRYELSIAREGVKHLDNMVNTNIAWVQSNCDISSTVSSNFSLRTKQKCKIMATERIANVYIDLIDKTLWWAIERWKNYYKYNQLEIIAKKYSKLKSIEVFSKVLFDVITKQLLKGWKAWLKLIHEQIFKERTNAMIKIQCMVRIKLARVKVYNIKLGITAITVQNLFRRVQAVQIVKEKKFMKEQQISLKAMSIIQKLFKKIIVIRKAKQELEEKRKAKAALKIQKIQRGKIGRTRYANKYHEFDHNNSSISRDNQVQDTNNNALLVNNSFLGSDLEAYVNTQQPNQNFVSKDNTKTTTPSKLHQQQQQNHSIQMKTKDIKQNSVTNSTYNSISSNSISSTIISKNTTTTAMNKRSLSPPPVPLNPKNNIKKTNHIAVSKNKKLSNINNKPDQSTTSVVIETTSTTTNSSSKGSRPSSKENNKNELQQSPITDSNNVLSQSISEIETIRFSDEQDLLFNNSEEEMITSVKKIQKMIRNKDKKSKSIKNNNSNDKYVTTKDSNRIKNGKLHHHNTTTNTTSYTNTHDQSGRSKGINYNSTDDATAKIQKIARGKLARKQSIRMRIEKDNNSITTTNSPGAVIQSNNIRVSSPIDNNKSNLNHMEESNPLVVDDRMNHQETIDQNTPEVSIQQQQQQQENDSSAIETITTIKPSSPPRSAAAITTKPSSSPLSKMLCMPFNIRSPSPSRGERPTTASSLLSSLTNLFTGLISRTNSRSSTPQPRQLQQQSYDDNDENKIDKLPSAIEEPILEDRLDIENEIENNHDNIIDDDNDNIIDVDNQDSLTIETSSRPTSRSRNLTSTSPLSTKSIENSLTPKSFHKHTSSSLSKRRESTAVSLPDKILRPIIQGVESHIKDIQESSVSDINIDNAMGENHTSVDIDTMHLDHSVESDNQEMIVRKEIKHDKKHSQDMQHSKRRASFNAQENGSNKGTDLADNKEISNNRVKSANNQSYQHHHSGKVDADDKKKSHSSSSSTSTTMKSSVNKPIGKDSSSHAVAHSSTTTRGQSPHTTNKQTIATASKEKNSNVNKTSPQIKTHTKNTAAATNKANSSVNNGAVAKDIVVNELNDVKDDNGIVKDDIEISSIAHDVSNDNTIKDLTSIPNQQTMNIDDMPKDTSEELISHIKDEVIQDTIKKIPEIGEYNNIPEVVDSNPHKKYTVDQMNNIHESSHIKPTTTQSFNETSHDNINIYQINAAIKIQNQMRTYISKIKVSNQREKIISIQTKLGFYILSAVTTIQRYARGKQGRQRFKIILHNQQQNKIQRSNNNNGINNKKESKDQHEQKKTTKLHQSTTLINKSHINTKKENLQQNQHKEMKDKSSSEENVDSDDENLDVLHDSSTTIRPKTSGDKVIEEIEEKIKRLEEIEKNIQEKEQKMLEAAKIAEERAEAMERAFQLMQEAQKKHEIDRLAREALMEMAAGAIPSHRSDYVSPYNTTTRQNPAAPPIQQQSLRNSARSSARGNHIPISSRRSFQYSARGGNTARSSQPSARSARGGAGIPSDAPHMVVNGQDWYELWDPEESSYYWYCTNTLESQWETPGEQRSPTGVSTVVPYYNQQQHGIPDDESGYESAGAMTDYSTDYNEDHSNYATDSEYGDGISKWQEYWDEQAQAKYWYNNDTGEASWTKPEEYHNIDNQSYHSDNGILAITNGTNNVNNNINNANEWVSYIDEDTSQAYWYNIRTGETNWA